MRKVDNLPPSRAVVTKSGKLNFLESSGSLRACNGSALLLSLIYYSIVLETFLRAIYLIIQELEIVPVCL